MNISLILTIIVLVITLAIPIIGTYKGYKKLQNTQKKLKDHQQEQRKIYEKHQLNLERNQLMYQEANKIHPDIDIMRKIVINKNNLIFPIKICSQHMN